MWYQLFEAKVYILLILLSCLLLLMREQASIKVITTYFLASIFGVRTISCLITGNCYQEVYYFLIFYALINILFVLYYQELKNLFPYTFRKFKDERSKRLQREKGILDNLQLDYQKYIKKSIPAPSLE